MNLNVRTHQIQGTLLETGDRSFGLICVSGSEGGIFGARMIAKSFYRKGIPSLAVAYFQTRQTPAALCEIPLETIENAVSFLKQRGYEKVGIYGFSKGAELALLSATKIPLISAVVAASPACCVFEGFTPEKMPAGRSSWTWRGAPLPYVPMDGLTLEAMRIKKRNRESGFSNEYNTWLDVSLSDQNRIPVEQIQGPLLLLSAHNDEMWPSERMGQLLIDQLTQRSFAYPFRHAVYHPASHLLCPIFSPIRFAFRAERDYPGPCNAARIAALELSVSWLRQQAESKAFPSDV